MEIILVYIIIAATLFMAAFITKRRFGLLGLALAAGSILSGIWEYDANLVASLFGIPNSPLAASAVSSIIVLLPAGVLLFHGNTYKTLVSRIIGACLFTLLAIAFLIEPLSHVLMPQGIGAEIYRLLLNNKDMIIGIGLIVAVVDLFLTKPAHLSSKHHKH
jgi:hypothetical protein